jgi:hypothetical protein
MKIMMVADFTKFSLGTPHSSLPSTIISFFGGTVA